VAAWQQCLGRRPSHESARRALRRLPPDKVKPILAAMGMVSAPAKDRAPLRLMGKDCRDCQLLRQEGESWGSSQGKIYLVGRGRREWLRVHLVSARWANHPWGFGNDVYDALEEMGVEVIDTDFRLDRRHLAGLLRQDAHLTFVLKGEGIPPELIRRIPSPTVLWYPDDLMVTLHGPRHIAHNGGAFDLVYGISRWDLGEYRRCGVAEVRWLPLACNPRLHRKLDLPKVHDVCFVGSIYPNRAALLARLEQRFDLLVTRAYTEEMVRIYNQSKIVLNLGVGRGNIPHRIFEALACGSLLLTNEPPRDLPGSLPGGAHDREPLFEDRRHLVHYNDDNIEELIAYYLAHDEERESIAARGRAEVLRRHTVAHRVWRVLRDALTARVVDGDGLAGGDELLDGQLVWEGGAEPA